MPPPELAADAPVPDVLQPVEVDAGEPLGHDLDVAVGNGRVGPPGDALRLVVAAHVYEPLEADQGLDHRAAPLAVSHRVAVVFHFLQAAQAFQLLHHQAPGLETLHSGVLAGRPGHRAVQADDVDEGQVVTLSDLEVHRVVARSHLQRAGAELHVDGVVPHHRYLPVHDGQDGLPAPYAVVARVVGVDGHCGVAQHGLRPGGGHGHPGGRVAGQRVADVIELAVDVLVIDFQVGQGGGAPGAPVDYALVPVDQPLAVEVDECRADGPAGTGVQGELVALPVGGDAQAAGLLVDYAAELLHVVPHELDETLPAQLVAVPPLFGQAPLDRPLGGDAGVVGAGQPQGGYAGHPAPADQGVFQRLLKGVAQVQLTGHVGRRHDDYVGLLALAYAGVEVALGLPVLVDALFNVSGVISPGHLSGGHP